MPLLYGIKETDLVFIIPNALVLDVFLWNTQELTHGWKPYDYSSYQRHRFSVRDNRWQMDLTIVDESIKPALQTLDMLCFSSQFYFLTALHALGMLLLMFGITIFLRNKYNMFGDPVFPIIFLIIFGFGRVKLDGSIDDAIAAKLALGAGRQKDLEQERLELQALNSERFRHRFMERNRPWILQHLVELMTPRTLQKPGADGRPNIEYVRDIYHELMNMGVGRRVSGDRSDISSDSDDDGIAGRANWSNLPVAGASKDLALFWLAKARKRRTFFKLITGVIASNKTTSCQQCQKSEEGGYTMHPDIATEDGTEQDAGGLDRLIAGFEKEFGDTETDIELWKAYFRKHAKFVTLCNVCISSLEQKRLAKIVKHPGMQQKARAEDISSDEEHEDIMFDPMIVSRTSIEGRVMSKWLLAARKRIGGVFPRPHARQEMEEYAVKESEEGPTSNYRF